MKIPSVSDGQLLCLAVVAVALVLYCECGGGRSAGLLSKQGSVVRWNTHNFGTAKPGQLLAQRVGKDTHRVLIRTQGKPWKPVGYTIKPRGADFRQAVAGQGEYFVIHPDKAVADAAAAASDATALHRIKGFRWADVAGTLWVSPNAGVVTLYAALDKDHNLTESLDASYPQLKTLDDLNVIMAENYVAIATGTRYGRA
jgi:hypothetical protein